MSDPFSNGFLNDQFNDAFAGRQTPYEPWASAQGDGAQYVSVLGEEGNPSSKRRVWERKRGPSGLTTNWAEVPSESAPFR